MEKEALVPSVEKVDYKSTIKQQVRLLEYFNSGAIQKDVDTSMENYENLLDNMVDKSTMGKVNKDSIKPFLLELDMPMTLLHNKKSEHNSTRRLLFDEFTEDNKKMHVVEFLSRGKFDPEFPINDLELENILRKYPTPIDAREKIDELLDDILYKQNNNSSIEYKKSIEEFLRKFYGKRYEYDVCFNEITEKVSNISRDRGYVQELTPEMNPFNTNNLETNNIKHRDNKYNKKNRK